MKYAKRMVLVPEVDYLQRASKPKKKIDVHNAAIAISQKLGKRLRKRDQTAARLKEQWDFHQRPKRVDMAEHLPPVYQQKARLLLGELAHQGVTYTKNNELVLPNREVLPQSNIMDLLTAALVTTRGREPPKPKGWSEFMENIAASGIPTSLFTKKATQRALARVVPRWQEL